jgi:ATP-dependent Clp protease ATP-binding subunit ClpX
VHRLLIAANHDVRRAESGIICLDEFDKIAKPKSMHGGAKDISGEGVQQALLKIIEGTTLQLHTKPERRPPPTGLPNSPAPGSFNQSGVSGAGGQKGETVTIDTSGILFIFTGAFIGLEKIISDRVAKASMGFNAHTASPHHHAQPNLLELTEPGDLISFGMIPEIVGRIPVTTAVSALSEEMLVRVLTEPRNALLRQYETLFALSGVELRFTSPALREVAKSALAMGTGARGLRTVVERLLSDAMFEAPGMSPSLASRRGVLTERVGTSIKHVLVNEEAAARKAAPLYFARGQSSKFEAVAAAEEETWVARGNERLVGGPPAEEEAVRATGTGA